MFIDPPWFQSTHPRGVRLYGKDRAMLKAQFQSTHPRGVRLSPLRAGEPVTLFQSTHPRGVRRNEIDVSIDNLRVSIHAPARGATDRGPTYSCLSPCFNPRTREGCDCPQKRQTVCRHSFNPRTREGCDRHFSSLPWHWPGFNPRTREGCDRGGYKILGLAGLVSIHAPARGATYIRPIRLGLLRFQSTHPRGVRPYQAKWLYVVLNVSIHAPARGATTCRRLPYTAGICFNPRTREGCDME